MRRVYTRSGDKGLTSIHGGIRVPKTDIRIEANGCLDELNVNIGTIRTSLSKNHQWQGFLRDIQMNIMAIMSIVATRGDMRGINPNSIADNLVEQTEHLIDTINSDCTPPDSFILPGGTPLASLLHQARVGARKAERRLWSLNESDEVPEVILKYINRLSDLFFVMSRWELQHSGLEEEIWKEFGYKRKSK